MPDEKKNSSRQDAAAGGSISAFQEKLRSVVDEAGPRRLEVDLDLIERYCALTGHDFSLYRARGVIPPGFLMTFTAPAASHMIYSFFAKFPGVVKGVIHTSSRVEYLRPMSLGAGFYTERIELKGIERKAGSKGDYFAVDFEVELTDDRGGRVATDLHQFFLRV